MRQTSGQDRRPWWITGSEQVIGRDSRTGKPKRGRDRRRLRPDMLILEDRRLLSAIVVNNPTDSPVTGQIDLRQAVAQANAATSPSSVEIELGTTVATITLGGSQLELSNTNDAVTIYDGPGQGPVTISGNNTSRVFQVDTGVTASLSGLTISGGSATYGAGLEVEGSTPSEAGGTVTLTDCTITGNTAGTSGGGMQVEAGGMATVTNSTLVTNSSPYGGAINDNGALTLIDCTIAGNSASTQAGGLRVYGTVTAPATTTLTDTIVAGDSGGDIDDVVSGTSSGTYNLIGTGDSGGLTNHVSGNIVLTASTEFSPTNPAELASLANYGGPTPTMALLPGSPALGVGGPAYYAGTSTLITVDQRGEPLATPPDIGAFQSQGFTLTQVSGSTPQSAVLGTAFAEPLAVTVTAKDSQEPVAEGAERFYVSGQLAACDVSRCELSSNW